MECYDRLLEEQESATQQTTEKIQKLKTFCDDYNHLGQRLSELSKHYSKATIIPFSSRAFVPAQIIHTNEVLVHLGGNAEHFCEVSTHQALRLIESRIDRMTKHIKALEQQLLLLSDRHHFTTQLSKGLNPSGIKAPHDDGQTQNEFEIREEYDPINEEKWQKMHKEQMLRERNHQKSIECPLPRRKVAFSEYITTFGDSNTSSSSSESFDLPIISFQHSNNPARNVLSEISDWSIASPADVVEHLLLSQRSIGGNAIPVKLFPNTELPTSGNASSLSPMCSSKDSPFLDIVERRAPHEKTSLDNTMERPVSRFRANRR